MSTPATRVAVIGAGMAGAACARFLADAGLAVTLFDKSRGVGGRMSTRRAEWVSDEGAAHRAHFDHGAPGFTALSADFVRFVEQSAAAGLLSRWVPRSVPGTDAPAMWVPTPDMPTLCRALTAGLTVRATCAVDALRRSPEGWRIESAGSTVDAIFDVVIVAIPPQQAAPLLQPHQAEWSQRAQALTMLPGWVLMGVTDEPDPAPGWDLARPTAGPLAWVIRNDAKPGRARTPGLAHWVAHAAVDWSQTHLEAPAAKVQAALQQAFVELLGAPQTWRYATVHRWRYATAYATPIAPSNSGKTAPFWWDQASGLGVCGDALGGSGVEGAWCSAQALAAHFLKHLPGEGTASP